MCSDLRYGNSLTCVKTTLARDIPTIFSLLVAHHWSSPHHTSLTHVGPDLAGHQIVYCQNNVIVSCLYIYIYIYKCTVVPDFRVACILP